MSHMKIFLVTFFALNLSLVEFAAAQRRDGGWGRDGRGGYGRNERRVVTCSARTTRFFEKHLLGHTNCSTCLAKHESCTEQCSETVNLCTVQGTNFNGRTRFFTATGDSFRAENEALRACENNRNMTNCVSLGCQTQRNVISNRNCQ